MLLAASWSGAGYCTWFYCLIGLIGWVFEFADACVCCTFVSVRLMVGFGIGLCKIFICLLV